MLEESDYWDIKQAAGYMKVSTAFLRKAVKKGQLPCVRIGTKILRFKRQQIDAWLLANAPGSEASREHK